ncbi:MAG: Uma2 family endonuclease [Dehalococcoidia bacterium]
MNDTQRSPRPGPEERPELTEDDLYYGRLPWEPTEDDLPYEDGRPMESELHFWLMTLLIETLRLFWRDRPRGYVAGDMFIYFSRDELLTRDFRGPDVFVVKNGTRRLRKSWVVWREGGGPNVVIELLSPATARDDRTVKKQVYQDELRVPEYFWYDPDTGDLTGFRLGAGGYQPISPDSEGRLRSGNWTCYSCAGRVYQGNEATWLRWATPDGVLLPTDAEAREAAQHQADAAAAREIAELRARLSRYEG